MVAQPKKSQLKRAEENLPVPYPAVYGWPNFLRKHVLTGKRLIGATATGATSGNWMTLTFLFFYMLFSPVSLQCVCASNMLRVEEDDMNF
jgi:hypothetical protein